MDSTESVTVASLMSWGVQTVAPDAQLESLIRRLRRIGHEGYPVVEAGRVIGLLTRRDADRALEHGLGSLTVRDVMDANAVTLRPDDPVSTLIVRMVESGWGQIPVVDDSGAILGVVTRTDLIKYWAKTQADTPSESIDMQRIASVLGDGAAALIQQVAGQAQEQSVRLYMVGGVVRDLLLARPNLDIDFVVEGDAIDFAESLRERYGGQVHSYRPFGTATWTLPEPATSGAGTPESVDFATARNEFYEQPTALPTVYRGSIKLDLARRDFTINTLAVQLNPAPGRILDFFGGRDDLSHGIIRVLHSLSFVDDPTRILRAVRFERRLGFRIEPRTAELIQTALPMLRRITGERVRNELTLLLGEADPEGSFRLLQERGILSAIHPAFVVPPNLHERFERARAAAPPWPLDVPQTDIDWCLLLSGHPVDGLAELAERLHFSKTLTDAILQAASLIQKLDALAAREFPPSHAVTLLESASDLALYAVWMVAPQPVARERIRLYASQWRYVRPTTDGHALRARGLKPGRYFGIILSRLRSARLDGEIGTDAEEEALLNTLLTTRLYDDSAE